MEWIVCSDNSLKEKVLPEMMNKSVSHVYIQSKQINEPIRINMIAIVIHNIINDKSSDFKSALRCALCALES